MTPASSLPRLHLAHLPRLVRGDGQELLLNEKDAALLALAALDGPIARTRVAALLWPGAASGGADSAENAEKRALNNLRQRLFRLARFAGHEVVTPGSTVALAADVAHDLALDSHAFLADAQCAGGDLLGSHRYDDNAELAAWVEAARQRWRASRADALLGLVTRLESEGRLSEALRLAIRLVGDEPVMEHASRLLMRLHYRRGDRGAALAEYERLRQALYEQHGDTPTDETIELSLTIGRADAPAPSKRLALPLALRHPPHTVGRDGVLARAEHRWSQRGVVLLLGAAGIGKTRVLSDLAQRWRVTVQWRCPPEGAAASFGLLSALAGELAPAIRARLPGELSLWLDWFTDPYQGPSPIQPVQPARLVAVWREMLAAAGAAGVHALAIEDLHYADEASVAALCELLPADASPGRQRWLLSCRDNELPAPLQQWIDRQPLGSYPAVPLEPLSPDATAEFLAALGAAGTQPRAAQQLHRHCGGHPLFMLQVLRQLHLAGELDGGAWPDRLPLPDDAMVSASQRLARADPAAQQMAFLAALCGPDFSADLMCRMLGQSASQLLTPWRRLEELHIFGANGFAHDLIREAVLAVVPQALAPLLQREIAAALEAAGANPLRRALHWEAGGESARAAAEFAAAARVAQDCGLDTRAIEWLRRASLNHRRAGQAGDAFECDWRAGQLMIASASAAEALHLSQQLSAEAHGLRQQALAAELAARAKVEQQALGAMADAQQALTLARSLGDRALVARCQVRLAEALSQEGRYQEALAELEAASTRLDAGDRELAFTWACDHASVLASLGRREEAIAVHRGHLGQALADRQFAHAAFCAGFCATHLAYRCRVAEAVTMARQGLELAHQAGVEHGPALVDEMGLAGNLGDLGQFTEALEIGERVIAGLRDAGLHAWAINATNDRAVLLMRLGRADLAQQLLRDDIGQAPLWVRAARLLVQARLQQWLGRPSLERITHAQAMFGESGVRLGEYPQLKVAMEAARATSAAAALAHADEVVGWADAHQHDAFGRYARMVRIESLTRLGDVGPAAQEAHALGELPGISEEAFGFYLPELLLVMGEALHAAGDDAAAQRWFTLGAAWIEDHAERHVPRLFGESFRRRNPVNARLMRWRAQRAVTSR